MAFGSILKTARKVASPLPNTKAPVENAGAAGTIKTGAMTPAATAPAAMPVAKVPTRSPKAWRGRRGGIGGGLAIGRGPAGSRNFRRMI
jgi:hypothetical protein